MLQLRLWMQRLTAAADHDDDDDWHHDAMVFLQSICSTDARTHAIIAKLCIHCVWLAAEALAGICTLLHAVLTCMFWC
jgi:hypothetical protein